MSNQHGEFVWYELVTDNVDAACDFYQGVLGWEMGDNDQPDSDYRIIRARDTHSGEWFDIGGMLLLDDAMVQRGARPVWLGYIAVDDIDQSITNALAAGAGVIMPLTELPEVGRIAMLNDPTGSPFYIIQSSCETPSMAFASDKPRVGHCAWNELRSSDPQAAKAFYFEIFGWSKDGELDMGSMGSYEFIRHNGVIGAVMPKPQDIPLSTWQYYFRCADIDDACAAIVRNGGLVLHGPDEIPGGDFIINGQDPLGAPFALVGARRT